MSTDLTFITNEPGASLLKRFKVLIKDARFFDSLVGYFYTSGFYKLYPVLEKTEKIRILIGIGTGRGTIENIRAAEEQLALTFSHAEAKEEFSTLIASELEESEDAESIEEGVQRFIDWIKNGKLEIRAYPTANIHAKLYIITFKEGDRDIGRVITGSSNFSQKGLVDNLEFNVELKTVADYRFAQDKFNQLWKDAVDVSEKYIETVNNKTWLNNTITPYELYLKFLYEYFKDQISQTGDVFYKYTPVKFKKLEYQEQAVLNAKKILNEYGGVFISDVVGLGKTYIAAMLANQLDGRNLVIAPPVLLDENNPGSWPNVFSDFKVSADFESIGKLEKLIERGVDKYSNVFIDEAHRFRTEDNITYEKLAQITRGKRVILVTATPYNNSPKDILSQIKLFQKPKKSTIPNLPNLEIFFSSLEKRLKGLDRQRNRAEYLNTVRDNAKEIREKVLKYLMVRRTRSEIIKYFSKDLEKQNLKFPDVANPEPILYQLDKEEDAIFTTTIESITQKFKYARYMPLTYYKGDVSQADKQGQKNIGKFMKILLVKRLESSFFAFRNTLDRFIASYERFLDEFEKGNVYVSKKYINKIFELLEQDDEAAIQRLVDEDMAQRYKSEDFEDSFRVDLENDLAILRDIAKLWRRVSGDPKLAKFIDILSSRKILGENKLIIFTESKETAQYLEKNLSTKFPDQVISFHGSSSASVREKVIENFDAGARFPKDDYRILITTEVLSEGVNLHRSNVVINYDIPWNPTRLMQRTGRINRVDTPFDKIYTFNFFPTKQSNDQIKLKEAAEAKIEAFIELLGADARLLTEGEEIKSHDLWVRLTSKEVITGEDEEEESDLKYLSIIRDIRDNNPDLFEKIKRLPKKARTARIDREDGKTNSLLTYFRKGKLQKFFAVASGDSLELDFISAAQKLEVAKEAGREPIGEDFYKMLSKNKQAFIIATTEEAQEVKAKRGRDTGAQLLNILKSREVKDFKGYTEEDELYLRDVMALLEEGALPKSTTKRLLNRISEELAKGFNPLKLLSLLRLGIPSEFFKETLAESSAQVAGPREVILSEYLIANNK
ncbi:helicase [Patescibacteria group bacterium]|nr:helicase [Patescibacteria group bacterium]